MRRELSEYGAGRILLSSLQVLPANQIKHHQNQLPDERQNQSSDEHQVATIMTYKVSMDRFFSNLQFHFYS